jgi:hypothetical protein
MARCLHCPADMKIETKSGGLNVINHNQTKRLRIKSGVKAGDGIAGW